MAVAPASRQAGMWASAAALACALVYIVMQLIEWAGMLGSAGGPNASSSALGIAILLTPSLMLGPTFVVTMAALHMSTPDRRKVYTLSGLCLAVMYATLTGLVYFVQLTFVGPRLAAGDTANIELLLFKPYDSFLFAIDLFGYSLMSGATLIAALGLPQAPEEKAARLALIANGILLPFLALQMFFPPFIWPASVWAITFPVAMALLWRLFRALPVEGIEP